MTYALVPGAGIADAAAEGYALNLPQRVGTGHGEPPAPLVDVTGPAVLVEAVKLADDRSGDVIVRLYESLGGRAATELRAGFPVARVEVVDLLERPLPDPAVTIDDAGVARVPFRPFQIRTLRLVRR
jgi:alpha-mannosidase